MQIGEITEPKIDQAGPVPNREFTYVDISSVDNVAKRIIEPKRLPAGSAPSRARQRLRSGDVLVSMTRPNLNAVALVPPELDGAIGSTGFHVLRARDGVLPQWLYYGVQTRQFVGAMSELVQGALYPAVRPKDIRAFDMPLPALDEQRSIVAELEKQFSRLDEAVGNLRRVQCNHDRLTKAILSAAVTGRLVKTESAISEVSGAAFESGADLLQRVLVAGKQLWSGKGQYADPSPPDTRGLAALPKGWTWASADQLSDFITKGTTPASIKLSGGVGDVQFLKVYNLTFDGSLNHSYKPAFVSRETHLRDLARSRVRPGDVLINIVGPPLGQVSVVPTELREANINQAIARIRPVAPLSTRYIALALMSTDVMDWAVRRAKTTAGQSNLTLELCRAIPIPLPPLPEQHRIVAEVDRRLSIAYEVVAQVEENLKRAKSLRQGALSKFFRAAELCA